MVSPLAPVAAPSLRLLLSLFGSEPRLRTTRGPSLDGFGATSPMSLRGGETTTGMVGVVMLAAALRSKDVPMFLAQLQQMFGIALPESANLSGAWGKFWQPIYRYPIIAAHVGGIGPALPVAVVRPGLARLTAQTWARAS